MTLHDHPDASTNAEQTRSEDEPLRFVVGRDDAWQFKTADDEPERFILGAGLFGVCTCIWVVV